MNAEEDYGDEHVSKTQIKQEAQEIKKLGEKLVNLGDAALAKIPLDDEVRTAVELARNINKKKNGYRRQLQFIGKLLRKRDLTEIEEGLLKLQMHHQQNTAQFHELELLRDKLIAEGDKAIQETLETYPGLERQKLRQLLRQIEKEKQQEKPPAAARELFQYLKSETQKDQ
ncbi:ribosome biogenesis factor YjgA [Alteromonas sp. a30]|uniref:ribosome biogenesis factor YjgA n=1 Tax=Alteromonas sp. a30 TaxID=2730917 RepID=UPI00227F92E1|nr:ribosome biogenesis factor YjgA [Alteromonas sp. a30]MCY7297338.1 ribosome-associated protein [Alteromonas sp. a30]